MSHSLISGPTYLLWCRPHARQAAAAADRGSTVPSPQGRPPLRASAHPPPRPLAPQPVQPRPGGVTARAPPPARVSPPPMCEAIRRRAEGARFHPARLPLSLHLPLSLSLSLPLHLFLWQQIWMFILVIFEGGTLIAVKFSFFSVNYFIMELIRAGSEDTWIHIIPYSFIHYSILLPLFECQADSPCCFNYWGYCYYCHYW
jgi:hypothetical protein